jgi:hypothetical protein
MTAADKLIREHPDLSRVPYAVLVVRLKIFAERMLICTPPENKKARRDTGLERSSTNNATKTQTG